MVKDKGFTSDEIAEGLLGAKFIYDAGGELDRKAGAYSLRWWSDGWYVYRDGCWYHKADSEMKRLVVEHLQMLNSVDESTQIPVSRNRIGDILLCMSARVRTPCERDLSTWDDTRERLYYTVPLENGLFLFRRNGSEKPSLQPHTPKYFALTRLPYEYDPDAKCETWRSFLHDVMLGRDEYVRLLQQWAGYLLRPDLREQKFLLCCGEGANGKGVFFEVIESLIGADNVSHVPISRFGGEFALYSTLGKLANMSDESSHIINDVAETILKSFVAGDGFTFERKFKNPVNARPTAKVMISTNALPRFGDKTRAMWRRILLVPFDKIIPDNQQIKTLATELKKERPGIFNWAVEGLADLSIKGFTEPGDSKELMEQYRQDSDPARAYLLGHYTTESSNGEYIACAELYRNYREWAETNGYRPIGERGFGQDLKRIFPTVERKQPYGRDNRETAYTGLVLRASESDPLF